MASTDLGGRSLEISTTPTSSTTVQSVLTIDSTVVMDTANYSCRASNEVANVTSSDASVTVYGKFFFPLNILKHDLISLSLTAAPAITSLSDFEEFTVHEGMSVIITCTASGFPAPTLFFFRGTNILTSNGRIQVVANKIAEEGTGGLSTASLIFTLSNAEDADSGEFSCVAGTDIPGIGSLVDTVNFNITVLGKKNYMVSQFLLSHMPAQVIG